MVKKKLAQEGYDLLVKKFDNRDQLFELLERHFEEYGYIPHKFLPDWNTYQTDKRRWRDIPGMNKKLWKIAKKMAKNIGNSPGKKRRLAEEYLDKQLKKLNARVGK